MAAKKPLDFGQTARQLARNPLGIIALFIVLIYATAGLVFGISGAHLEASQSLPLIWFLVLFPVLVFVGFVWLVAKHSHNLYAPSDFRDDETFVQLNRKLSIIEVRQQAAEVDPRADSDSAFTALNALLKADQSDVAKNLAKAFLKVKRYEVSLKMFGLIIESLEDDRRNSLLQYRAYSFIGLGRYEEALLDFETLRSSADRKLYDFWPRIGLAFCHLKLKHDSEFRAAFNGAVTYEGASQYRNMVSLIYPELAGFFSDQLDHFSGSSAVQD